MAVSSGTSVVGSQKLIESVPSVDQSFSVDLTAAPTSPFSRVGYYYLVRISTTGARPPRVVSRGIVFRPGVQFVRPGLFSASNVVYDLWVDWNFGELEWAVATGAA